MRFVFGGRRFTLRSSEYVLQTEYLIVDGRKMCMILFVDDFGCLSFLYFKKKILLYFESVKNGKNLSENFRISG